MVKIAPSILAADSTHLGSELIKLEQAKADFIHFDVMDGHFVPNLTFGPKVLKEAKRLISIPFDVHLMVSNPFDVIPWYAEVGADILTFHIEATNNPNEVIKLIRDYGIKVGVSIKPNTDLNLLLPYIDDIDLILIMAVEPGFGGQKFQDNTIQRISDVKNIIGSRTILLEVDGGITTENASLCIKAGANVLVAGTSIFYNENYAVNIQALRGIK